MAVITASIEELAPVVGAAHARALMMAFAGRRIYVPKAVGADHPIAACIGAEGAAQLCSYYSLTHLEFPVAAARRRRVLDLAAEGLSDAQIAAQLWMTDRTVRRIRSEERERQAAAQQQKLPL